MLFVRAHVVTPELTFRGHELEVDRDNVARIIDRRTGQPVAEMVDAGWSSDDGQTFRVAGTQDGNPMVWRAVKACARCSQPMVYATPDYDIPT